MRNQVTFYTELEDKRLIEDNAALVGGYDITIREVPDAPGKVHEPSVLDTTEEDENAVR